MNIKQRMAAELRLAAEEGRMNATFDPADAEVFAEILGPVVRRFAEAAAREAREAVASEIETQRDDTVWEDGQPADDWRQGMTEAAIIGRSLF